MTQTKLAVEADFNLINVFVIGITIALFFLVSKSITELLVQKLPHFACQLTKEGDNS